MRRNGNWLGNEMDEWGLADELAEIVAYCCAERKNKEAIVVGKLMVVNFYYEQWGRRLSLPRKQFRIEDVEKRFKRALVEGENHARVRRPLTWEMIRVMEESIGERGIGGRIGWIRQPWTN